MKQKLYYLIVVVLITLSCNPPDIPVPVITSVSPEDLHPGLDIIIEGQFLNDISYVFLNEIKFNGYSKGSDSIIAKIPRSIAPGTYSLSVMSKEENSNIIQVNITHAKPVLDSISPSHAGINDILIINGYFFANNGLVVKLADLVISSFIEVNDSIIKLLVTDQFKSGQLSVENEFGSSTSKPFNFDDNVTTKQPRYSGDNPIVGAIGDTLIVIGGNFKAYPLSIVFPVNITLQENFDFRIISDSLLSIKVPQGVGDGFIHISNEFGSFEIEIDIVDAPVISIIRPKSNPKGGPMLIYGKNLEHVEKIKFGNSKTITAPDFEYFPTSEGEDIIALHIPDDVQPGEILVRLALESDQIHSEDEPFTVLEGTLESPVYLPAIVTPNPPPINILNNLNNEWLKMDEQSRISMNVDSETEPGQIFVTINNNNVGTVNEQDNSITLFIDSREYYGKLDDSYTNDTILRLILTPVEQGNQIEMVYPFYLKSLSPEKVHPGDSITVSGRYFKDKDSWGIQIGAGITLPKEECRKISDIMIKLEIPREAEIGVQSIIINNADNPFILSNSRTIEIVSE